MGDFEDVESADLVSSDSKWILVHLGKVIAGNGAFLNVRLAPRSRIASDSEVGVPVGQEDGGGGNRSSGASAAFSSEFGGSVGGSVDPLRRAGMSPFP